MFVRLFGLGELRAQIQRNLSNRSFPSLQLHGFCCGWRVSRVKEVWLNHLLTQHVVYYLLWKAALSFYGLSWLKPLIGCSAMPSQWTINSTKAGTISVFITFKSFVPSTVPEKNFRHSTKFCQCSRVNELFFPVLFSNICKHNKLLGIFSYLSVTIYILTL